MDYHSTEKPEWNGTKATVLDVAVLTSCGLSVIGTFLIFLSYILWKDLRSASRRMLVYLSLCDLITALGAPPPSKLKIPSFIPLPYLWSLYSHGLLYITYALSVSSALERQWLWSRDEERRGDLHNSECLHIDLLRCFLLLDCVHRYALKAIIHMFLGGKGHKEDNYLKTRLKKHI